MLGHTQVTASRLAATDDEDSAAVAAAGAAGGTQAAMAAAGAMEGVARARGRLVSAMMKKHLVESVVPLLIELKHTLQVRRGDQEFSAP